MRVLICIAGYPVGLARAADVRQAVVQRIRRRVFSSSDVHAVDQQWLDAGTWLLQGRQLLNERHSWSTGQLARDVVLFSRKTGAGTLERVHQSS